MPPSWATRRRIGPFGAIWVLTAVLFVISPLLAPGSMSQTALLSMLPFAAILAIAAVGQTLVVQQGGIDLSVPGMISVAAVVVTKYPNLDNAKLLPAILLALAIAALAGLVNGLAVTWFRITPLVATLGVNALLVGTVQQISGGFPTGAAPHLSDFALHKTLGVPNTLLVATMVVLVAALIVRHSVTGRRFQLVGASPATGRAAGLAPFRYQLTAYVAAAVCYSVAGILLAGFLKTPSIFLGDAYLLPTIAAVVLGGTSLIGGVGSVLATAGGALFLSQLNQVILARGAPTSVQFILQGSIIAIGMGFRELPALPWVARLLARRGSTPAVGAAGAEEPRVLPEPSTVFEPAGHAIDPAGAERIEPVTDASGKVRANDK